MRLKQHKREAKGRFKRSLLSIGIAISLILASHAEVVSQGVSIANYTAFPPFVGTMIKPNILINLDTSTSLGYFAYDFNWNAANAGKNPTVPPSTGFNSAKTYYGYFGPDTWYRYDSVNEEWTTQGASTSDWKGSFLNWLTMRRSDIIKKALIGGKTKQRATMITSMTSTHNHDLVAEVPYSDSRYLGYQKEVPNSTLCSVSPLGEGSIGCLSTGSTMFTFDNDEGWRRGGGKRSWWLPGDIPSFSIGTAFDSTAYYKIVIHLDNEPEGVIQRVGDNVRWGLQVMNNGLETTDSGMIDTGSRGCHGGGDETGGNRRGGGRRSGDIKDVAGGTVLVPIGYDNINDKMVAGVSVAGMVTEIAIAAPYTPATPIAESLWSATGYFMQYASISSNGPRYYSGATNRGRRGRGWRWGPRSTSASYPIGDDVDPYNYADDPSSSTEWLPCAKSFVITITDGEPTADRNIDTAWISDAFNATYTDSSSPQPGWAGTDYFWQLNGSHYVDEVAFYGHVDDDTSYRDLRTGLNGTKAIPGDDNTRWKQNLTHYFIYAHFGSGTPDGKRLLNWSAASGGGAARNGGFVESGTNYLPDKQAEYDANGNGVNDNFYNAEDGYRLEAAFTNAIYDAIQASSGTAASTLANTANGEGVVYQSYFFPEKQDISGTRTWLGYIQALFIDENGNLREDSNGNNAMDERDSIIRMAYSLNTGVEVFKCTYDQDQNVSCPSLPVNGGLESIKPIWDGGDYLWGTDPAARKILTTIDGSTLLNGDFSPNNSSDLMPHLRASNIEESGNIIKWIRGDDLAGITDSGHPSGYRQRGITIGTPSKSNVWKLGDIVHSTPTVVGRPMENYDLLYGESSYTAFRGTYLERRQVVYAGANDGMLHAFNAGFYDVLNKKYCADGVINGGGCASGSYSLGEELWSFIPRGLLPHLKWLTDPDYTHVYYVDLKPKITDVKIFTADSTHVNGWGTILIGGFRYGGKDISWTSGLTNYSTSPEYFALDITDPLNPSLLWTFSDPGLGLSMSYPSISRTCDADKANCEWFAIFGSGATDHDIFSNLTDFQDGNVFVLKISGGTDGAVNTWTEDTNFWKIPTGNANSFMANPISIDVDMDFDVDVIYVGENLQDIPRNAYMYRITSDRGTINTPLNWSISTLANIELIAGANDSSKTITAAPSAAMDDRSNLWVYWGTGQFLGESDKNQTDTGAFYAIVDECWSGSCNTSYTDLLNISAATIRTDGSVSGASGVCGGSVSSWTSLLNAAYSCNGWAMYFGNTSIETLDFTGAALSHNGERVISKPLIIGGLVIWATYIPGETFCSYEGESNIYAVYYKTGTAYSEYIFNEQEESGTDPVIGRVKRIGAGMPSPVNAQVTGGGTVMGFVQQSTGSIVQVENNAPISLESETLNWKGEELP